MSLNESIPFSFNDPFNSLSEFFKNPDESSKDSSVFACMKVISEGVAQLPLHVYKKDGKKSNKQTNHHLYEILHSQANNKQSSFSFFETMQYSLLLRGNAYALKVSGRSPLEELVYINPDFITPFCVKDGESYYDRYVAGSKIYYQYINPKTSTHEVLLDRDILHIQGLSPNGLFGINVIEHLAMTLGYSIAAREHGARYFKHGGHPSVVLTVKKTMSEPIKERMREAWIKRFSGVQNAHQCLILEEGSSVSPLSISNVDSQFLESRKYQRSEIAAIFNVPPHKIGDLENASFSNIEQQSRDYVNHTLMPWNIRWEQAMNHSLLTKSERKKGYFIKFNVDGLLRGDSEARAKLYTSLFQTASITPNEIRALENLNPTENGDETFYPLNMQSIKNLGKENEK